MAAMAEQQADVRICRQAACWDTAAAHFDSSLCDRNMVIYREPTLNSSPIGSDDENWSLYRFPVARILMAQRYPKW